MPIEKKERPQNGFNTPAFVCIPKAEQTVGSSVENFAFFFQTGITNFFKEKLVITSAGPLCLLQTFKKKTIQKLKMSWNFSFQIPNIIFYQ